MTAVETKKDPGGGRGEPSGSRQPWELRVRGEALTAAKEEVGEETVLSASLTYRTRDAEFRFNREQENVSLRERLLAQPLQHYRNCFRSVSEHKSSSVQVIYDSLKRNKRISKERMTNSDYKSLH